MADFKKTHMPSKQDDYQLIELGRALDVVLAEWVALVRTSDADQGKFEKEVRAATCLKLDEAPDAVTELHPYWRVRHELARVHGTFMPAKEFEARLADINRRAMPIANAIAALPAVTLAGLAVKVRALQYIDQEPWRDGTDPTLAALCEDVCRISGVPSLAAQTGTFEENLNAAA